MTARVCVIEGCGKPHQARGWCTAHYNRWYRNGHPALSWTDTARATAPHGTYLRHRTGCRCLPCRAAAAADRQRYMTDGPQRVSPARTVAHLQKLFGAGWTQNQIATAAGVSPDTVRRLVGGGWAGTVNRSTERAVTMLRPEVGPLVLPSGPLVRAFTDRGVSAAGLVPALAREFFRARRTGRVGEAVADRLAVEGLGLSVVGVYGPGYDEVAEVAA